MAAMLNPELKHLLPFLDKPIMIDGSEAE